MTEPPRVKLEMDWRAEGLGRLWLISEQGIKQWDALTADARAGLRGRARMVNALARAGKPWNTKKAERLKGGAKGAVELKLQDPLARGIGFVVGWPVCDWYLAWFSEGQHPKKGAATEAGKRAVELKRRLFGEST